VDIVTLDFETYYSADYSLRKKEYNTSSYVRDPQFKAQCVGIKINDEPVRWYRDKDIAGALNSIKWDSVALLCHNTNFDGLILSHHYGIVPAYYLDTLSMARALHSNAIGAGLDEVARFYGVGNKLPNALGKTKGVRDLSDELMTQLAEYCAEDVRLTYEIYQKMRKFFPQSEIDLIDITVRMFADPVLEIDIPAVEKELAREIKEQEEIISRSGYSKKSLSSADTFAEILRAHGVEPPTKFSEATGKEAWAFAKTDVEFQALADHEDERVRNLYFGRLAAKSTINETRAYRFLKAGENGYRIPVLLNYFGAHTGRWTAGNKMNMQNLPSTRAKCGGALRKAILAPKGYKIVVCDSAQIEARVLAWFAGQLDLLEDFRQKVDVYSKFGTELYQYPVSKETPTERHVSKGAILGLGFGMGAPKMKKTFKGGTPSVDLSIEECQVIVQFYRNKYKQIPKLWRIMDRVLAEMSVDKKGSYKCISWDGKFMILPNGLYLMYPFLRGDYNEHTGKLEDLRYYDLETGMKMRFTGETDEIKKKASWIWGGTLTENIIQALARIIVADQMRIIAQRYRIVMMTHDEVVALAPENEADECLEFMIETMSTPPSWAPDIPLGAEGGYADNYSK
jgi:DNA polymerase I-like protein with 3'-5' exonuclease and polymerase domains